MEMFKYLDIFFTVFHSVFILFNLFGWIWCKTRKLNLITLLLTGLSWTVLGLFYGFGYCPLTDWHWQVLHKLGKFNFPSSYIEFLLERLSGLDFETKLINILTLIFYLKALSISIYVNIKKKKTRTS